MGVNDMNVQGRVLSHLFVRSTTLFIVALAAVAPSVSRSGMTVIDPGRVELSSAASPLANFELNRSEVSGCKIVTGLVTLSAPAATNTNVTIADNLNSTTLPAVITVPAGATSKAFTITTAPVALSQSGTVNATIGSTTLQRNLVVKPMGLLRLTAAPTPVVGGKPVEGYVRLECKAGPGPLTVTLGSSNPAKASPVATNVVVPVGVQSTEFDVTTMPVLSRTWVTLHATVNGSNKSKEVTLDPGAAVSPASLRFGNVTVGTTSGVLSATLTNKGATSYFINSITITGSYASWFLQTNNCPSSLIPGASCTIGIKFKPKAAASRSAKLSISTTASTLLSVGLSGTGAAPP